MTDYTKRLFLIFLTFLNVTEENLQKITYFVINQKKKNSCRLKC